MELALLWRNHDLLWRHSEAGTLLSINHRRHCVESRGGELVPQLLAGTFHGTAVEEVVQLDFLQLRDSKGTQLSDEKYICSLAGASGRLGRQHPVNIWKVIRCQLNDEDCRGMMSRRSV